jgi:ribosome-binding ATPase YchF (GTP1/OBG family)
MKIKIGLCGLPNSGKSTFIKLVSQVEVLIAPYPFTTLKAQEYAVPIISQELKNLYSITQTPQIVPPYLIFVDVPGLIRGAHKGEGLGNEFLSYLRGCDVILEIVRNFKREDVPHPEGSIDPLRDIKIIEEEIRLADEEILKRAKKEKVQSEALLLNKDWFLLVNGTTTDLHGSTTIHGSNGFKTDKADNINPYESALDPYKSANDESVSDPHKSVREYPYESVSDQYKSVKFKNIYTLDLLLELEILEYADLYGYNTDQHGFDSNNISVNPRDNPRSSVMEFLNQFRKDLGLIQFFTFTKEITQGWFIKKDSSIIDAARMIHSDFALKFKVAETISLENFVKIKDWEKAKKLGLIRNKGREAKIEENEIIFVKI